MISYRGYPLIFDTMIYIERKQLFLFKLIMKMFCCRKIIGKRNGVLILITLFLWSCNQQKDTAIIYKKPLPESLDATCTWLDKNENFNKATYMPTFYNYYNQKIKEKKFLDAAKALKIVSWKTSCFQWYRQSFLKTITDFSNTYRNKIPAVEASFIDFYLGVYYSDYGNYKKAISYFAKTTSFEVVDYETCYTKASGCFNIAWSYNCLNKQNLAFSYCLKALKYYEKLDNKSSLGLVYATFAEIYKNTKDFKNSEKSINRAIYYYSYDRENQEGNIFSSLINKADLYNMMNDTVKSKRLIDSTFIAFNHSKVISQTLKITIYTNKIDNLLNENKITEAKKMLDDLKPIVIASNSVVAKQEYDLCLSTYKIKNNNGFIDTTKIIQAIPLLLENQNYSRALGFYSVLYKNALAKKDYKNTLHYYQKMNIARDSMESKKMANILAELHQKYQTEKKEQQIILQKKTISNNKITIALLAVATICLFLLVFGINIRHKQRKAKLEKQNSQLYTKQLLNNIEEERKRIASDLHDSVNHELLSLKNYFEEKADVTNRKIDSIIDDIRNISRNLHPVMFDKIGLKASIEQIVERTQVANNFMVTADVDYNSSLPTSDELQVYRIIQEALSNTIKYADAMASKISVTENNNTVFVEIKDNGKGFDVNNTLNGPDSFGLHNIIERGRSIGGKTKIRSNINGTIISIKINKIK